MFGGLPTSEPLLLLLGAQVSPFLGDSIQSPPITDVSSSSPLLLPLLCVALPMKARRVRERERGRLLSAKATARDFILASFSITHVLHTMRLSSIAVNNNNNNSIFSHARARVYCVVATLVSCVHVTNTHTRRTTKTLAAAAAKHVS